VLSSNCCCSGQGISITYSEYVSIALVIQHAKRMHCIMLSSVAYPALPYYLINGMAFWKKVIEHKMRVLIFSTIFSETIPILRRNIFVINVRTPSSKVSVILVRF